MDEVDTLCEWIKNARTLVVLTGAGISVASGIPDFRSGGGNDSERILTYGFMRKNPDEFTSYLLKVLYHPEARPNRVHYLLRGLEERGYLNSVITQNIDDLDFMAGTKRVYPIHGSIHDWYCDRCEKAYKPECLSKEHANTCTCGGFIRPRITLYGEMLDETWYHLALTASQIADTFIVMGSSLRVSPASSFVRYYAGHHLAILSRDATPMDKYADLIIRDDLDDVAGRLLEYLGIPLEEELKKK